MRWEPGSPRCHEIIDNDFPLRYITTNKIRVAATTIDLWELMAVMVCVTNLDDHRRMAGFGDIKLYKIESDVKTGAGQKCQSYSHCRPSYNRSHQA